MVELKQAGPERARSRRERGGHSGQGKGRPTHVSAREARLVKHAPLLTEHNRQARQSERRQDRVGLGAVEKCSPGEGGGSWFGGRPRKAKTHRNSNVKSAGARGHTHQPRGPSDHRGGSEDCPGPSYQDSTHPGPLKDAYPKHAPSSCPRPHRFPCAHRSGGGTSEREVFRPVNRVGLFGRLGSVARSLSAPSQVVFPTRAHTIRTEKKRVR